MPTSPVITLRDRDYLRRMTLVMGQRNQPVWDIPVADSFELNRAAYRTPYKVLTLIAYLPAVGLLACGGHRSCAGVGFCHALLFDSGSEMANQIYSIFSTS